MPLKFLTHHRLTGVISILLVAAAVLVALRDVRTAGPHCPQCSFKALVQRVPIVNRFVMNRATSINSSCVNNLRRLDGAKQQWALERHHPLEAIPSWQDIAPHLAGRDGKGAAEAAAVPRYPGAIWPVEWVALGSEELAKYVATNGPLAFCPAGGTYELRSVEEEPLCSMRIGKCGHTNFSHVLR